MIPEHEKEDPLALEKHLRERGRRGDYEGSLEVCRLLSGTDSWGLVYEYGLRILEASCTGPVHYQIPVDVEVDKKNLIVEFFCETCGAVKRITTQDSFLELAVREVITSDFEHNGNEFIGERAANIFRLLSPYCKERPPCPRCGGRGFDPDPCKECGESYCDCCKKCKGEKTDPDKRHLFPYGADVCASYYKALGLCFDDPGRWLFEAYKRHGMGVGYYPKDRVVVDFDRDDESFTYHDTMTFMFSGKVDCGGLCPPLPLVE